MTRLKAIVEYDGTTLHGFQRQEGLPTAQGYIEEAIFKFSQEHVEVFASGRTDAGVHARGQVIHWDMACAQDRSLHTILRGINFHLIDSPVMLLSVGHVADDFHARFSSRMRHYRYEIIHRTAYLRLDLNRAWHVLPAGLDVYAMQQAAALMLGDHDFTSFRSTECQGKSPLKTLNRLDVITLDESHIRVEASARSFLHHQVRNMVGTLVEVGQGKRSASSIPDIFAAKNRAAAGQTAPAHGLYFMGVEY